MGRFISPDWVVQDPSDPQSFNRYSYVRNNPVNLVDPTGNFFWFAFFIGLSFVSTVASVVASATGHAKFASIAGIVGQVAGIIAGAASLLNSLSQLSSIGQLAGSAGKELATQAGEKMVVTTIKVMQEVGAQDVLSWLGKSVVHLVPSMATVATSQAALDSANGVRPRDTSSFSDPTTWLPPGGPPGGYPIPVVTPTGMGVSFVPGMPVSGAPPGANLAKPNKPNKKPDLNRRGKIIGKARQDIFRKRPKPAPASRNRVPRVAPEGGEYFPDIDPSKMNKWQRIVHIFNQSAENSVDLIHGPDR
ncbi:hypothetical protein HY626_04070 [Candidatus Uhrbacteria bacterium]|nr:hypothetical protein [Candidatus Uhrbacteria bacterium]